MTLYGVFLGRIMLVLAVTSNAAGLKPAMEV